MTIPTNSPYKTLKDSGWRFPPLHETFPEVFIIEFLREEDEEMGRLEGLRLADTLRLADKQPKYFYIRNKAELALLAPIFVQSKYRYLHISCHGGPEGFELQDDFVKFDQFGEIFGGALALRRFFVSACSTGERSLVDALHNTSKGIQSIIAPCVDLYFSHASVIWAALYVSLLELDNGSIRHQDIVSAMQILVELFPYADSDGDSKKEPMKFMFAGYDSTKDTGGTPNPDAWRIQEIQSTPKKEARRKKSKAKGKKAATKTPKHSRRVLVESQGSESMKLRASATS